MGKRLQLDKPYCARCRCSHPPGDHHAMPKAGLLTLSKPIAVKSKPAGPGDPVTLNGKPITRGAKPVGAGDVVAAEKAAVDIPRDKILPMPTTPGIMAEALDRLGAGGDGVALESMAHPKGSGPGRGRRIKKASLETVEIELPAHLVPKRTKKLKQKKKPKMSKPVSKKLGKAKKSGRAAPVGAPRRSSKPSPTTKPAKTKAVAVALVDAEVERKRALKTARQQRWRDKQKVQAL